MVLAYVLIEGWIVHPYVYCFFDGSDEVLILPPHNAEISNGGTMTCDVVMVIYWGIGRSYNQWVVIIHWLQHLPMHKNNGYSICHEPLRPSK